MVLMTREVKELARDKIRAEERVASNSLRNLIYSIAMTVEDKYKPLHLSQCRYRFDLIFI